VTYREKRSTKFIQEFEIGVTPLGLFLDGWLPEKGLGDVFQGLY
jgi:hypothetical protein